MPYIAPDSYYQDVSSTWYALSHLGMARHASQSIGGPNGVIGNDIYSTQTTKPSNASVPMWLNRVPRETAGRSQLGGYAQEYASIFQQQGQQVVSYNHYFTQQPARVYLPFATDLVARAPSQSSYVSFTYTTQTFSHTQIHSTLEHTNQGNTYYYTAGLNPEADPFHTKPRHVALQRRLDSQKRLEYQQRLREGNYDEPTSPFNSFFHPLPTNYSLATPSTTNVTCSTPSTNAAVTPPDNGRRIPLFQPAPSKCFDVSWISPDAPGSYVMSQGTSWRSCNNDGEPGRVQAPFTLPITITKPPPLPRHHTIPLPQVTPASYKQKYRRLAERVIPPPSLDMEAVKRLEEEEGACYDGEKVEAVGGWMEGREEEEEEDTVIPPLIYFPEEADSGYESDEEGDEGSPVGRSDIATLEYPASSWDELACLSPLNL